MVKESDTDKIKVVQITLVSYFQDVVHRSPIKTSFLPIFYNRPRYKHNNYFCYYVFSVNEYKENAIQLVEAFVIIKWRFLLDLTHINVCGRRRGSAGVSWPSEVVIHVNNLLWLYFSPFPCRARFAISAYRLESESRCCHLGVVRRGGLQACSLGAAILLSFRELLMEFVSPIFEVISRVRHRDSWPYVLKYVHVIMLNDPASCTFSALSLLISPFHSLRRRVCLEN